MNEQEILNTIALTRMKYFNLASLQQLYLQAGSATELIAHSRDIRAIVPDASEKLVEAFANIDEPLRRAEVEMAWCKENGAQIITFNDSNYPQRLRECGDAPLILYYKGTSDLNALRVISIVGTRHCTNYGKDLIQKFISELRQFNPNILIVSGMAYGIDICAHNNALDNGFDTVAVLAHGLDTLYPAHHKETAKRMLTQGGLLTEFMTMSNADKRNFIQRNRIVAGIADATLVVESAAKGGGLITASIARSYGREVFAFPGAIGQPYSEGCNQMIRDNKATLLTSAEDLVKAMGWTADQQSEVQRQKGIERQLFPDLNAAELQIVETLRQNNDLTINSLSAQSRTPIDQLPALLFSLEMKGVLRLQAGNIYHLIQ